jgi:hypothetical protein
MGPLFAMGPICNGSHQNHFVILKPNQNAESYADENLYAPLNIKQIGYFMSNTEKPEILVDTFGKDAPAAAKAGQGARSLDEIKQATEARTRPGQYNNSDKR